MKRVLLIILLCALSAGASAYITQSRIKALVDDDISAIIKESHADQSFIEKIPIYEDFVNPQREEMLRKHLFNDHYNAVLKTGMKPVHGKEEIADFVEKKLLVPVKAESGSLFFFYGVKEENRFLAPAALASLEKIAARFNERLEALQLPRTKIALSSALRSDAYQKDLRKTNSNASFISTHSYGMSFDIFYDDYYIILPESNAKSVSAESAGSLRRRFGFVLGDSLRRQLRSILFETLLDMQDKGEIYAIAEKNQHCYHVTPIK
ncbi:MAG: DUF5715 family protein [Spirochaetia bacterium]|jgi:hypothetical protein|nr:DUF5715 family protein [Spirochaetia bacterium]